MFANAYQLVKTTQLYLPAFEVALFVALLSLALLYRYNRAGLVVAYVFAYRWGWLVVSKLPGSAQTSYVIRGILVGALTVVSMLSDPQY